MRNCKECGEELEFRALDILICDKCLSGMDVPVCQECGEECSDAVCPECEWSMRAENDPWPALDPRS